MSELEGVTECRDDRYYAVGHAHHLSVVLFDHAEHCVEMAVGVIDAESSGGFESMPGLPMPVEAKVEPVVRRQGVIVGASGVHEHPRFECMPDEV